MGDGLGMDVARQAANVVGAIFQVVAGMILARGEMPGEEITQIQPSNFAFVVWAPIFMLFLAYAVYQALPAQRESPLRTSAPACGLYSSRSAAVSLRPGDAPRRLRVPARRVRAPRAF